MNSMEALKSIISRMHGIQAVIALPIKDNNTSSAQIGTLVKRYSIRDEFQEELESLGVNMNLFKFNTQALKLSFSQMANGQACVKADQQQNALNFFKSAAKLAFDSFVSSSSFSSKVLSIKMRIVSFVLINKYITIGEYQSQSYLHWECANSLDALISLTVVQNAIKVDLESSKAMFSSSSRRSFNSTGGRVLMEIASLIHWVEQLTQLRYQISKPKSTDGETVSLSSMQTKLKGHRARITCIATHNQYIFSGAKDHMIKVWDINTLALVATLQGHNSTVSCLAVLDDMLYSGSSGSTVRMWDIRTLKEIARSTSSSSAVLQSLEYTVRSLAVDMATNSVFVGCSDGVIRVLEATTLQSKGQEMRGHKQWVTSLTVHENNLFSASMDCCIKVWDITSYACINVLSNHTGIISSLVVAGGRLFSGSHDKTVRVWDLQTFSEVSNGFLEQRDWVVRSLATANNKVYVGYADDRICVLDAFRLHTISSVQVGLTSYDNCLAVADGKMFVGSAGKTVHVRLL